MNYICYFTFKITHYERHYLADPTKRTYSKAISREKDHAFQFQNEEEAEQAISKLLKKWDYGRHPKTDYSYVGYVQNITTDESILCARA